MRYSDAGFLILLALLAWSIYRVHKDQTSTLNVFDLVMENGRLSKISCAFILTLLVTSWIMIRLTVNGKMTEAYLMAYGGMWVAPIVAKMFSAAPPAGTTTTDKTSSTTVTVEGPK